MSSFDQRRFNALIGRDTINRPYESMYAFVSRLIRSNLLTLSELKASIPLAYLRAAFDPSYRPPSFPSEYFNLPNEILRLKLSGTEWEIFPSLVSSSTTYIRGCAKCLSAGYHTNATQSSLLASCPLHGNELTQFCPMCETPLLFDMLNPAACAFRCPRGCSLSMGSHAGLCPDEDDGLRAPLEAHLAWLDKIKSQLKFVSGPVHVTFPPYSTIVDWRSFPFPSNGLFVGICDALRKLNLDLPDRLPFHQENSGAWEFKTDSWIQSKRSCDSSFFIEVLQNSFHRGTYSTLLPIPSLRSFLRWRRAHRLRKERFANLEIRQTRRGILLVPVPSYLITNNEIVAMRNILAGASDPSTATLHYESFLFDSLDRVNQRRFAFENFDIPSNILTVAEHFEGVVQTSLGKFRILAVTHGDEKSQSTWLDFHEQADLSKTSIEPYRRQIERRFRHS